MGAELFHANRQTNMIQLIVAFCKFVNAPKKGERNCISNYRSISQLTSYSKVSENVMYVRLLGHLNNNNISVEEQFGIMKNLNNHKSYLFTD